MKDIQGYEGLYAITSCGKVWSYRSKKFLSPADNGYGYLQVILSKNGETKHHRVHQLVAAAYIPNPEGKPQVNHLDENKKNNNVNNLEWATCVENINYGTRNQRIRKPVRCIETGEVYESVSAAAADKNVSIGNISNCINGRYKTCGGYHWERVYEN